MLSLLFANILHRKVRSLFTILGLALATATLYCLLAFQKGYDKQLHRELAYMGAHILVVPKGCPYDSASLALHGANWPCYLKESYLSEVAQTPNVAVAAPVFMAAHIHERREIYSGVNADFLKLRPNWQIKGRFPTAPNEVLLGAEIARSLMVHPGAPVSLAGLKQEVTVSGVLDSTHGPDDQFIFMPLREAQSAFKQSGHLTHIYVKLQSPELLESTILALRGCNAGMQMNIIPLSHLFETIRNISSSSKYLLAALSGIAFLVAGTALANTMFMAVLERTREFGMLRAVGASTVQVFILILGESSVLGMIGVLSGFTVSLPAAPLIENWVRTHLPFTPVATLINFDPVALGITTAFTLLVAGLAGLIPAFRAMRLHPIAALRAQANF
jgi:putative ABC transport system permease protein